MLSQFLHLLIALYLERHSERIRRTQPFKQYVHMHMPPRPTLSIETALLNYLFIVILQANAEQTRFNYSFVYILSPCQVIFDIFY